MFWKLFEFSVSRETTIEAPCDTVWEVRTRGAENVSVFLGIEKPVSYACKLFYPLGLVLLVNKQLQRTMMLLTCVFFKLTTVFTEIAARPGH